MKFIGAAVQMVASDDKAANLKEAERWVRHAADRRAKLVALPEVFIWRGSKKIEREQAEPIPGPSSMAMAALARPGVCSSQSHWRSTSCRQVQVSRALMLLHVLFTVV